MGFKDVSNKVDFVALERETLAFWRESGAFEELRRLRAATEAEHGIFSFIDGPITANNPMGVHHGWGRTYKDLYPVSYTHLDVYKRQPLRWGRSGSPLSACSPPQSLWASP